MKRQVKVENGNPEAITALRNEALEAADLVCRHDADGAWYFDGVTVEQATALAMMAFRKGLYATVLVDATNLYR